MKSQKQLEERILGKTMSRSNLDGFGWGAIKEIDEEDKIKQKEEAVVPAKHVVKRPFLTRGSGKAGGVGAAIV